MKKITTVKNKIGENNPNWKGGISVEKRARREYQRQWYERNKNNIEFKRKAKEYRILNAKKLSANKVLWKQNNPVLNIWSNAKYRATRKGLEFNLEPSDIVIPEFCPYLGVKLTSEKMRGHLDTHMSLDRKDSTKGYIKGNVEVISYKANAMKQDATIEQLLTFSKNILERFDK